MDSLSGHECGQRWEIANVNDLLTFGVTFDKDSLHILLEGGEKMKGAIRCKGKCKKCGGEFKQVPRLGFICPDCKTIPKRFFIDLWYQGKRIRLFADKTGQALDTYQRAENLLSHIRYEIQHYTFEPSKYIKSEASQYWVTTLLDKFLDFKLDFIAPSYKSDYERMTRIAKGFFRTKDVREIRKLDIVNFKTYLEKNFLFKAKTVKNILDFFKTFLRYLKHDLEVIDNVPSFPAVEIQPYQFRWLQPEEQVKIIENVAEGDRPIITFLMLQGCRPGEARALKCKNVNLRDLTITISASFSREVYREKRKGRGAKPVVIPIHPEMVKYLKERVSNNLPEAFVFCDPKTGGPYTENALRRIWDSVKARIGISKPLRLYDATRHSFASQLVNMGSTLYKVSKLMGHSSTKTTERYAHPSIESLRTDLERLSLTVTKFLSDERDKKDVAS